MRDFKTEINELKKVHKSQIVGVQQTVNTTSRPSLYNRETLNIPGSFKGMEVKRFAESSILDQYAQRSPTF